jgi:hypothetical protein
MDWPDNRYCFNAGLKMFVSEIKVFIVSGRLVINLFHQSKLLFDVYRGQNSQKVAISIDTWRTRTARVLAFRSITIATKRSFVSKLRQVALCLCGYISIDSLSLSLSLSARPFFSTTELRRSVRH